MNLMITAHLKQSFENWKKIFDEDDARAGWCNESKTMVGKVDDKTALIVIFDVDQAKMNARLSSPEFAALVANAAARAYMEELMEMNIRSTRYAIWLRPTAALVSIVREISVRYQVSGKALAAGFSKRNATSPNRWLAPFRSLISRTMLSVLLADFERFVLESESVRSEQPR